MKQGSNKSLQILIDNLDISLVNSIIFTFKNNKSINSEVILTKNYDCNSEQVTYSNNNFYIHFTQDETIDLNKNLYLQAQINYVNNYVDFSDIVLINVMESLNVVKIDE